ncbi:MAG TPA: hypothetical protein VE592_11550 [Geminicoccaceae bacterium]|nr:hypothetical protein [Geminicoccaceae bacterium]
MAIGNMDLYRALREAGVSEERASEAAKSVAGYMPRFRFMLGTLAVLTALVLGVPSMQWQIPDRLSTIEARLSAIELRLPER